jgi:hypothetical protein
MSIEATSMLSQGAPRFSIFFSRWLPPLSSLPRGPMRAHAYGGLGFRVRVSESSLYSLFIPPEPSLLWRDDRLFLRPCVSVWLCGYDCGYGLLWSSFGLPRGRRSGRCTTITRTGWCRTVLCGDGGRRGDTSDPRRTSRMEWTKGSPTGWTGKPYRKQEGGPKAERRTDWSKRPGGSLSPAPAATRSISICIT